MFFDSLPLLAIVLVLLVSLFSPWFRVPAVHFTSVFPAVLAVLALFKFKNLRTVNGMR